MSTVRNVVLLSVDALRADHLSCYGYSRKTTPNLDTFANENITFGVAYSVSSHTREAIPGLLTGKYPDDAIANDYRLIDDPISVRAKSTVDATAAFHSNPYVSQAFGFNRGFDTFDDDLHLGKRKLFALAQRALDKFRNRHYARASEINERSFSWIDSLSDERFFLWNHYMDPHGPYIPVDEFRTHYTDRRVSDRESQRLYKRAVSDPDSITDEERQLLIDFYDAEIRYTDARIREFLEGLERRGLLSETAVIITADHGDAFGEQGYYEHPRYLHDGLTRVPLIIGLPDAKSGRIKTPVSTLDIVPTILDLLGLTADSPGRSLIGITNNPPEDRAVFGQASGEGEHAHLRRFAAWNRAGYAFGTYDSNTQGMKITEQSDDTIAARLNEHMSERTSDDDGMQPRDGTVAEEEVEQRLSALGYKE